MDLLPPTAPSLVIAVQVKRLAVHGEGRSDSLQRRGVQNVVPRIHMRAELT